MAQNSSPHRLQYLDGLRGIAILMVVLFHYLYLAPSQNPAYFPYQNYFSDFWLFKYGYLGVEIFFAISGFVISQSLVDSQNIKSFFVKRVARLIPGMLVFCTLTYFASSIRPINYDSSAMNFFPSLTFTDPRIYNQIFQTNQFNWMDPSYWSLFDEIRFYFLCSLLYFLNKDKFFYRYLVLSTLIGIIFPITIYLRIDIIRSGFNLFFIASTLPWFTLGIGCFLLTKKMLLGYAYIASSLVSLWIYLYSYSLNPYTTIDPTALAFGSIPIFIIMTVTSQIKIIQRIFSFKPLTFVGISSYGLYLVHQNIGEKLILAIGNPLDISDRLSIIYPVFVLFLLALLTHASYKMVETPTQQKIVDILSARTSKKIARSLDRF